MEVRVEPASVASAFRPSGNRPGYAIFVYKVCQKYGRCVLAAREIHAPTATNSPKILHQHKVGFGEFTLNIDNGLGVRR
jgi:hypothetical protein